MPKAIDLSGKKFGRWTVLHRDTSTTKNGTYFVCRCECGKEGSVLSGSLRNGQSESCGCAKQELLNIINRLVETSNKTFEKDALFWVREMKLAKELIATHGKEFMLRVPPREGYKSPSLAFFKTQHGKNYLSDQKFEYARQTTNLVEEKKEVPLAETKIGEDIQIKRKPRSLKDFINYGKENTRQ